MAATADWSPALYRPRVWVHLWLVLFQQPHDSLPPRTGARRSSPSRTSCQRGGSGGRKPDNCRHHRLSRPSQPLGIFHPQRRFHFNVPRRDACGARVGPALSAALALPSRPTSPDLILHMAVHPLAVHGLDADPTAGVGGICDSRATARHTIRAAS